MKTKKLLLTNITEGGKLDVPLVCNIRYPAVNTGQFRS